MQLLYNAAGIPFVPAVRGFLPGLRTVVTATGATTYTPSKFAKILFFQVQAAGGGGKNCANAAAGQIVLGGGGSAGGYSEILVQAPAGPLTINVGTGGSGTTGASGNNSSIVGPTVSGAATTSWCIANGGTGGGTLASGTTQIFMSPTNGAAVGTTLIGMQLVGHVAYESYRDSGTVARSGRGADSYFGTGGRAVIAQGAGNAGGLGAGGSGGMSVNAGGAVNGGNGGAGLVIVWEYY